MILFSILFFIGLYAAISVAFLVFVRSRTERPLYALLAVILIFLVPTWDMVLGAIVYFPSCFFFPKVVIHETARTDGIYYEGINDYFYKLNNQEEGQPESQITRVGTTKDVLARGYSYIESKVSKKTGMGSEGYEYIPSAFYRCAPATSNGEGKIDCIKIERPQSRYMVKVTTLTIGQAEISFKKVVDISTGKLMAKYNQVKMMFAFPFFNWLYEWPGGIMKTCPDSDRYYNFEYDVLKSEKVK